MIGARTDAWLYRGLAGRRRRAARHWPDGMRWLETAVGPVRVRDTGGDRPPVVFAPDGPCTVEHYDALVALLRDDFRVVVFDLPGFGFSAPDRSYGHGLAEGGRVVAAVLVALELPPATLALSCVNGFYAMAAARLTPERVARLVLCQTPDLAAMKKWAARTIPSPIETPLIGQLLNYLSRRRLARIWLRMAVADEARQPAFLATADDGLRQGGCYCLAGVVQGMLTTRDDDALLQVPADIPVTLVWGRSDPTHRRTDPQSLRAHCPHLEVVTFDDAGHLPDLEAPERYAALLRDRPAAS